MKRNRPLLKRPTITAEQWEQIREESEAAKELLSDPRFSFLRGYLENAKTSIIEHFVNNRIKKVVEQFQVGGLTKSLTTTKEEQANELSGQYKFIEQLQADLERIASQEEEYRKASESGKVVIEGNTEKDG